MHYHEWFCQRIPPVANTAFDRARFLVCVHGLTRNSHDFDCLARYCTIEPSLSYEKILCPDIVGRGQSDWLSHREDYTNDVYANHIGSLLAATLDSPNEKIDYIGTSMGGLIGMLIACRVNSPIRKLVINDVGPWLPKKDLERIGNYIGSIMQFPSWEKTVEYFRTIYSSFGLNEEQIQDFARFSVKPMTGTNAEGFEMTYDPGLCMTYKEWIMQQQSDIGIWPVWDNIKCPVMLIRGKQSTLLLQETVEEMKVRGPGLATIYEVDNVGHAPALLSSGELEAIKTFLQS